MIAPKGRLKIILSFVLQKLAMEDSSLSVISSRSSGDEEARQQLVATSSTLESWTLNCRSTGHTSPHLVLDLFRPSPPASSDKAAEPIPLLSILRLQADDEPLGS